MIFQLISLIKGAHEPSESESEIPEALQKSLIRNNIVKSREQMQEVISKLNGQLQALQQQIIENQIASEEFYRSFNAVCDALEIPQNKESVRLELLQERLQ